jgi:spermidine synthase
MIILIITLISSFSTMAYSMIVASLISDFTGEEIYSQCFTIGPYLLGLGLGSYYFDRKSNDESLLSLWNLEFISSLVLPLYPLFFNVFLFLYIGLSPGNMSLDDSKTLTFILSFGAILSFVSGILGGGQLPLIMKSPFQKVRFENILAINYLGPLLAGPFIVYLSQLSKNYATQSGYIGLIQFIGIFGLIFYFNEKRKRKILLLILPLMIITFTAKIFPKIEYLTAKASYILPKFKISEIGNLNNTIQILERFGNLERKRSPYQMIEVFTYQNETSVLYLNRKVQFNNHSSDVYHETMLFGTLNLTNATPENILVLGGGDGILLNLIQKTLPTSKTVLVELDEEMINLGKTNFLLRFLNNDIFENLTKNNSVLIDDAVTYLRRIQNKKKFDLIFIDFPFPNGHELSKLYSKEFYSLVKNVSKKDTIVTIDLPLSMKNQNEFENDSILILRTIYQTGFKKQLGYGPHSSFVSVSLGEKELNFDYNKMPENISLAAKLNLFSFINQEAIKKRELNERVNSMFWPKRK